MSPGEKLLASVSLKREFRDGHDRRAYMRSLEIAKRIVDDPSLLLKGRQFLERHVRPDAHQQSVFAIWSAILDLPAREVARILIADDERGQSLRETAPVFTVILPASKMAS